ncbi:hypothetical protein CAURIC_02670 [Corynebacterium auriscanis]|nr:hypothetical protein CAURIC_02670 [Corynebacterium auriscanis]
MIGFTIYEVSTSLRKVGRPLSHSAASVPFIKRHTPSPEEFIAAQQSAEFQELRTKQRGFTFPLAIAGIAWFVVYVLLAMYAPSFMSIRVLGNINIAILMGVAQFVTTFAITWAYVKYADKHLEPRSRAIREALERTNDTGDVASSQKTTR